MEHENGGHTGSQTTQTIEYLPSTIRQNQISLTEDARRTLAGKIKSYIDSHHDPVAEHLSHGHVHGTPDFLPWHRVFF